MVSVITPGTLEIEEQVPEEEVILEDKVIDFLNSEQHQLLDREKLIDFHKLPVIKAFYNANKRVSKNSTFCSRLEDHITEAVKLYDLLDRGQKENLGILTSLYTELKFGRNADQVLHLKNLDFLNDLGLAGKDYLLNNLTNTIIEYVDCEGGSNILSNCNGVIIGKVSCEHVDFFGSNSNNLKVYEIDHSGSNFGATSNNLLVQYIKMAGCSFGFSSKNCKVDEVDITDSGFAVKSKDFHLTSAKKVGMNFGTNSTNLNFVKIGDVGDHFGLSSLNLSGIEITGKVGTGFGSESNGLTVDKINEVGDRFGSLSKTMTIGSISKAHSSLVIDSEDLSIGYVGIALENFGRESRYLKVKNIGLVLSDRFGEKSHNMEIGRVGEFLLYKNGTFGGSAVGMYVFKIDKMSIYNHNANNASVDFRNYETILKNGKSIIRSPFEIEEIEFLFSGQHSLNKSKTVGPNDYAFRVKVESEYKIFTDRKANECLPQLGEKFGYAEYDKTMNLLNVSVGDPDEL